MSYGGASLAGRQPYGADAQALAALQQVAEQRGTFSRS
jgi:hypothetical protein